MHNDMVIKTWESVHWRSSFSLSSLFRGMASIVTTRAYQHTRLSPSDYHHSRLTGPTGSHPLLIIYDYHRARLACRHKSILECIMMVTEYGSHATSERWANIFNERDCVVPPYFDYRLLGIGCIMMLTEDGSRLSGTSRMIISTVAHRYSRLPP